MDTRLPVVYLTQTLLDDTARLLSSFTPSIQKLGSHEDTDDGEGVVYWFGLEFNERAVVTTLVVPDADTTFGSVRTSAVANAEALSVIVDTPLVLLGQAHSHPSRNVDHSWIDDRETFAQFPGAISVVFPFYGRGKIELVNCGVHRLVNGMYRRLQQPQVAKHMRVMPGLADFRRGRASV